MFLSTVERIWSGPVNPYLEEGQDATLATATEALARLRFSILLTARWEAEETGDAERRGELRDELARIRAQYFERIDDIAMTYGVQQAMDAQQDVERSVTLPRITMIRDSEEEGGDFLL